MGQRVIGPKGQTLTDPVILVSLITCSRSILRGLGGIFRDNYWKFFPVSHTLAVHLLSSCYHPSRGLLHPINFKTVTLDDQQSCQQIQLLWLESLQACSLSVMLAVMIYLSHGFLSPPSISFFAYQYCSN